jgi:hypothetical protein
VALGWPHTFINFLTAPSAPNPVKNSFGAQNVSAPPGMNPQAIPGKARRIMTARFDATGLHPGRGGLHVLYVAPTHKGGFCYQWTRFAGGCFDPNAGSAAAAGPLGITSMGSEFPKVIVGYVQSGAAKQVRAEFADGDSVNLPITWVSSPINAGFFVYPVPAVHQTPRSAVQSIVALDANGKVIGRQSFLSVPPGGLEVQRRLPDGTLVSLSASADLSTARRLIDFRATNGSRVWLWVMDRRGGGRCYVFNQGSGCSSPAAFARGPALAGGLAIGGKRVLFFTQVKRSVAAIELRYQDGSSEQIVPTDGFALHEITPQHYAPGKRLVSALALDGSGHVLHQQAFQPQAHGTYPCSKPVARGYGVESCP